MSARKIFSLAAALFVFVVLVLVIATCGIDNARQQSYATSDTDTLPAVRRVNALYLSRPTEALAILDDAERRKSVPEPEIQNLRAAAYWFGLDDSKKALACVKDGYNLAIECSDTLLQLHSLKVMAAIYYSKSHYTDVILYSNKALELAQDAGNIEAMAYFYMALGCAKSEIDNIDDAIDYLSKSIEYYQNITSVGNSKVLSDMLYAMIRKMTILVSCNRHDDALEMIQPCRNVLTRLKSASDIAIGLAGIRQCEFLSAAALVYYRGGDTIKARQCYDKLDSMPYSHSAHGIDMAVPYLVASGQYSEALHRIQIKKRHLQQRQNTVTYYYIKTLLRNELECYSKLAMYKEATRSACENAIMADSLRSREKKDYVKTVKKLYADTDMQLQLVRHQQQAKTDQMLFVLAGVVVLALVVLLSISIRYSRKLRLKDRANMAVMEELRKSHVEKTSPHIAPIPVSAVTDDDKERKMFVVIYNEIITRKLYLQPGFSREDALAIVPMSLKQISALFQKYSTGFTSFVNNLRLEHSLEIIRSNPDYTIEGVALESGFGNRQTFHRLFVEKYGMTPMEYKRLLDSKNTL